MYSIDSVREYASNVDQYLGELESAEVRNLAELIAWNEKHADKELPFGKCDRSQGRFGSLTRRRSCEPKAFDPSAQLTTYRTEI